MNLKEMKRIAEGRTKGKWEAASYGMQDFIICPVLNPFLYYGPEDAIAPMSGLGEKDAVFIAMAANKFDKLLAVVEAAHGVVRREEIGGYGFEGIPELKNALNALEAEE